jgi:hypothetical protein
VIQTGVCGIDLHLHAGQFVAAHPLTPRHEAVGVLDQLDDGVTDFAPRPAGHHQPLHQLRGLRVLSPMANRAAPMARLSWRQNVEMTNLQLKPGCSWAETYARCVSVAPEAFESGRIHNLLHGEWQRVGVPGHHVTPVDLSPIHGPPRVERDIAVSAVEHARDQHAAWSKVGLAERRERVTTAIDTMVLHRDLLALLLVWEIGKPWRLAVADVDRCLDGVRWYVDEIERQLAIGTDAERRPLPGPVSNIASWNYPMSVQVHAELVQVLAGNAVVAKTPSQGGFHCLTLAHAFMARAGLPVTLLSGIGGKLGDVLISNPRIGALAFVGADPTDGPPLLPWPTAAAATFSSRKG